jgi:hypothetical protein
VETLHCAPASATNPARPSAVPAHRYLFRDSSPADRLAYLSRRALHFLVLSLSPRFINLFFLRFPLLVNFVQSFCASSPFLPLDINHLVHARPYDIFLDSIGSSH